jgi:hypothetical protein
MGLGQAGVKKLAFTWNEISQFIRRVYRNHMI